jgi:2-dehydro-3-deoxy-D-gluconate 5-dehydrogenase
MDRNGSGLFDLSGKVALVTGARAGLGRAMAVALAGAGADIAGLGRSAMPETRAGVEALGRRYDEVLCDLSSPPDFDHLVAELASGTGRIDILVNNAGIIRRSDFLSASDTDWDEVLAVNLRSVFQLSQAVARHMVAAACKGRIVNIGSLLSFQGGIRVAAYAASKHAIAGLTQAMSNELAPLGITVNAIAPGYMVTANTEALRADHERSRHILDRIPAGRWGVPEDLATAILFLASPASGYVTGAAISVDGGWLAR